KNVALVKSSFIGYTLVMTTTLGLTSNIWGDKPMAAETWFVAQQGSVRANEHLSNMLLKAEKFEESAKVTEHLASQCDECVGTKLQYAVSKCLAEDNVNVNVILASVEFAVSDIKNANRLRGLPEQLVAFEQFRTDGTCGKIDAQILYRINFKLAEHKLSHLFNPLRLIQNMYEISVSEKDFDDAERLINQAWGIKKQVPIAAEMVTTLNTLGKTDKSIQLVDEICATPNYFGPYRLSHEELCNEFRKLLDVENHTHES
ncbi:MAG: hypothetical protein AAGJ37_12715, partial [Pseudomonadota bacterium]